MKIENIGVMSPGDMGQAVAQQIKERGYNVFTALDGRSPRSKALAEQAALTDLGSIAALTARCDVILSVMNPGSALEFADEVANALAASRRDLLFVDCNATAPVTVQRIAERITAAGGRCVDGSILGPPPRGTSKTRLFLAGPAAGELLPLAGPLMSIEVMSERIGDASALKMCYAALTKGVPAIALELLIAARRLGVSDALEAQLKATRSDVYGWLTGMLPVVPPKAHRWVPEMLEIARTLESTGLTPRMFEGAAEVYGFIAQTALGGESPEAARKEARTAAQVIELLAAKT